MSELCQLLAIERCVEETFETSFSQTEIRINVWDVTVTRGGILDWFSVVLHLKSWSVYVWVFWSFSFFFSPTERAGPYPQAQLYWAGRTEGWMANRTRIGQRYGASQDTRVTRTLTNVEHPRDSLKMHPQSCCEAHPDLAELRSYIVRSSQESSLNYLTVTQKIRENLSYPNPYPQERACIFLVLVLKKRY